MSPAAPANDASRTIQVRRAIPGRIRLSLLPNRRIESTQALQVANEIVQVAFIQTVDAEGRHRGLRIVDDRLHLVLLVSLDALTRVHDLDREQVFVLLHAPDRLTV